MPTPRAPETQKLMSSLILVTGAVLMAGKISADGEPGLIPIVLVALGLTWFVADWVRTRSVRK